MIATQNAKVFIDGTEIEDWSGFEIYRRYGESDAQFNIDINRPIDITPGSKATIKYGFGNSTIDSITNKLIEQIGNSTQQASIRGIGSQLTNLAPIKNIVFVNETWLKKRWPNYTLIDGNIHMYNPGQSRTKFYGVSVTRLFIEELPGKETRDVEFECIIEKKLTYKRVAEILASRIIDPNTNTAYTLICNVPNLEVQKTLTIGAGESYFQAISRLFNMFRPIITIEDNRITISSLGDSEQARPSGTGAITLTEDSFSLYQYNSINNYDTIDHVLVVGPSRQFTHKYYKPISKRKLTAKRLQGETIELTSIEKHTDDAIDDYFELTKPIENSNKSTIRKTILKMDTMTGDSAVIREEIKQYSASNLEHQIITTYEHADYETVVSSNTEESARVPQTNSGFAPVYVDNQGTKIVWYPCTTFVFTKTGSTYIEHNTMVEELGMTETTKKIGKLMCYQQDKVRKDGETYFLKSNTYSMQDVGRIGIPVYEESSDADTGWRSQWIELFEHEITRLEVATPSLIRKNTVNTRFYPMTSRVFKSEDMPIKKAKRQDKVEKRWLFIKYGGAVIQYNEDKDLPAGLNLHPRVVINCPDIVDARTAEYVAKCAMASKPTSNISASIRTTVTIPGLRPGMSMTIPTCNKEYFDWGSNSFQSVNITGGTYWVTGVKLVVRFTGSFTENSRTLEAYNEIELRKNF